MTQQSHIDNHAAALGTAIRKLRLDRGLSLGDVHAMSGVSKASLSRMENGHVQPTAGTLVALAGAFGVQASFIMVEAGL